MNCPKCGAELPAGSRFCNSCGTAISSGSATYGSAPPPPSAAPTAPAGGGGPAAQAVHCPSCGGPLHPIFGEMVITCDYCGGSVALGGAGWKEISKHTLLVPKVSDRAAALEIVRSAMDIGLMHRKAFEESTVVDGKLSFVPFWILPVSASTSYTYTDVAVGVGSTVATVVGAELLGAALGGGRRGGFIPIPIVTGPTVNPTRQDTITGTYEFPIVAVKAMSEYQPKNYAFALSERTFFDKKVIPDGAPVLNGDLGQDAGQHAAHAYVMQLQSDEAHRRHHMVSGLRSDVNVAEGELLHVPVWYFVLDRKGVKTTVLIDAHAGQIMQTVM